MHSYYTFLALDIAADRAREADRQRLATLARRAYPDRDRSVRRGLALAAAALSRGSAALVRRLDDCVADDLASGIRNASSAPN